MTPLSLRIAAACLALGASQATLAQATLKNDGQWRAAFGLGASFASGNSQAGNISLSADAVRATADTKLSLYGKAQYARSNEATTDKQARLGARYDHDLSQALFSYVSSDFEHNKLTDLQLRSQLGGGLGAHLLQGEAHSVDVFGGLSYTHDKYSQPTLIDEQIRGRFSYASLMLGEESSHQLSDTASLKQRLTVLPNLKDRGEFRANWDASLAVAINKRLSLDVGLSFAHNSDPGLGRKPNDTLLTTGISVKFD